eukprot:NODE_487_length_7781_cov_0.322572.p1 type:complete len:903 gc:universal NODE_487_length_7781_cov_0.322572:1922-4630(+)
MEEQSFCRICRGHSDEEPLSQPCRCDGSVRFIHQSCLQQWLSVSQKTTCELCKFEFVFTPVYAEDAPDRIPILIVCRRVLMNLGFNFIKFTRFTTVGLLWLVVIPWLLFVFTHTLFNTINLIPHPVKRLQMASMFPNPTRTAEILEGQIIYAAMIASAIMLFFAKELLGLDQLEDPNRILQERVRQQHLRDQLRQQLLDQDVNHDGGLNGAPLRRLGIGNNNPFSLTERTEIARLRIERLERRLRNEDDLNEPEPNDPVDEQIEFPLPAVSQPLLPIEPDRELVPDYHDLTSESDTSSDSNDVYQHQLDDENAAIDAVPIQQQPIQINLNNHNNDPDSITELLGFTGSLHHALHTALIVLACLFVLVIISGYIPLLLGYSTAKILLIGSSLSSDQSSWSTRFLLILIGYSWIFLFSLVLLSVISLFTNRNSMFNKVVKVLDVKIKNFIKITVFLSLELVGFPLYSGVLLVVTTTYILQKFNSTSYLEYLIKQSLKYPLITLFLTWFCGTLFMFNFSMIIDKIRQTCRPGVLWFLRDPTDPDFKPIYEITTQPVSKQLYKLLISAMMYFTFIVVGYGLFLLLLSTLFSCKPYNTQFNLQSEFPLDLLVFHFCVPLVFKVIDPKQRLADIISILLRSTSKLMGLQDYMLKSTAANTDPAENSPKQAPADSVLIAVPNRDSFRLPSKQNAINYLSSTFEEYLVANNLNSNDWIAVHVPHFFKLRLFSVLIMFWSLLIFIITAIIFCSIMLGRSLLNFAFQSSHDIYSLLFGFSVLGLSWHFCSMILKMNRESIITMFNRFSDRIVSFIILSVIVPIGLMSLISLVVMMPSQVHNEKTLIRHYLHEWAIGIIYVRVFYVVYTQIGQNIQHINDQLIKLVIFIVSMHAVPYAIGILASYILGTLLLM